MWYAQVCKTDQNKKCGNALKQVVSTLLDNGEGEI
jgi:hypothetical protein